MDFMILSTPMVSWESHGIKSRKISLYHNMVIGGKDLSHDIMINDNKITRPNKKKPGKNLDPDRKNPWDGFYDSIYTNSFMRVTWH